MKRMLTIKNLQVKRNNKVNLNIQQEIAISPQDKVAILGENGAGKTTLINAILGEINYDGTLTKDFRKDDCGIVFQQNAYNPLMKVYELIQLALALDKVKLAQFVDKYELADLQKKYIKNLSGGEEQRLTLSLVLESQKRVYFFDELTSGLDYKKRLGLLALMREKTKDATVFNVTHYFEEIENWVTKILLLKQGHVVFFGAVESFLAQFKHDAVIKIEQEELSKLIEGELNQYEATDTGDGKAVICYDAAATARLEGVLKGSVTYKVIPQSLYTTYLVADASASTAIERPMEVD